METQPKPDLPLTRRDFLAARIHTYIRIIPANRGNVWNNRQNGWTNKLASV
jgi:hypothetical protein